MWWPSGMLVTPHLERLPLHLEYSGIFRTYEWNNADLIHDVMLWQKGSDVSHDLRCFILNFGYKRPSPFPEFSRSVDSFHLNVGTHGSMSPSKCSIVVIGGKYLDQQGRYRWILTDFPKFLTTFWPLLEIISPFFLTNLEGNSYHESQITASSA